MPLRLAAVAALAALAAVAAPLLPACNNDQPAVEYLGAVDAGSVPFPDVFVPPSQAADGGADGAACPAASASATGSASASGSAAPPPAPIELPVSRCSTSLEAGSVAAQALASAAGKVIVPEGDGLRVYPADGVRCPVGTPAATVLGEGLGAPRAAAEGVLLWVGGTQASAAYDSSGKQVALCKAAPTLGIAALADVPTRAYGVDGSKNLRLLSLSPGPKGTDCTAPSVTIGDGQGLATAIAPSSAAGKVWIATTSGEGCTARAQIARYVADTGALDADGPVVDTRLVGACSVDAVIELAGRLVVADAACRKLLVIDAQGSKSGAPEVAATIAVGSGSSPRALAAGNTAGDRVLVLLSSPTETGAKLELISAPIPTPAATP